MNIAITAAVLVISLVINFWTRQDEKNKYDDYEKYDVDPAWVIKHGTLVVLMILMTVYFLFFDPGDKTLNTLICVIFAFLIATMFADIFFDSNRYIFVKGNKLVISGQMLDRKQIKGYHLGGLFKGNEIVTFNSDKIKCYKSQLRMMGELSEKYHFQWKHI